MSYRAPVEDFSFIIEHVIDFNALRETSRFSHVSQDVTQAILREAGKM